MKLPVIFDLDDNGEATGTIHWFCCIGCRSQSPYKLPEGDNYGTAEVSIEPVSCELCGRVIKT